MIGDDADTSLGDLVEDAEGVVAVEAVSFTLMQGHVASVLDSLTEREAAVMRLRFGLVDGRSRTLDYIGSIFGVTGERIRQIEAKTMSKTVSPGALVPVARLPRLNTVGTL